jgi:hypothetical protein
MKPNHPRGLTPLLVISAWMTYRILGFVFAGSVEALGGNMMASAWIIPLGQDALVGITAPAIVYLMATRPGVLTYALSLAWLWWGNVDFVIGLIIETYYPPAVGPFGPHVPDSMLSIWLYGNLAAGIYAFYLLLTPRIRAYFVAADSAAARRIADTPLRGGWVLVIVGAGLMGLFFPLVAASMDMMFEALGFQPR